MPFSRLSADVSDKNGAVQVEVVLMGQQGSDDLEQSRFQKHIRVNGLSRRATDLIGVVRVVMFDPHDTDIVGGSPVLRRRYLDATNSQIDSIYLRNLQQYNKIVLQRNHLLRMIKEQRSNPDELQFWDEQLVESGSYLIARRQSCVNSINTKAAEIHKQLTTGTEDLETIYVRSVAQQPDQDIAGAFLEALQNARGEEIVRGMSTVGPHRDDLQLLVGGVNMCIYGSRGQHRTIALSLKLAQAKYIESLAGDTPILLLDDVLSELDSERRRRLLNAVEDYEQAIITSTDWDHFDANFLSRAIKFKISQGNLDNI